MYVYTCVCVGMGWLRLVGSLILQVSFAEYRLFCRAILQERPSILRSILIVATPYKEVRCYCRQADSNVRTCIYIRIYVLIYI